MIKFFKSDIGIISCLTVLFFVLLPFFFLHQGLLLIDTGREFYIPQQINNGGILYKNLYNIYGALSYQFNAVLFSLFGEKFNTLYIAGIINSLVITIAMYMLSREFLNKKLSFLISILIIFGLVYRTFLYNSNLTYSFAIVYALSSFLISLIFLIKYIKTENTKMAYLSCLFCGISIANKYEFSLYPLVIAYTLIFIKPIGIKNFIKALGCFILVPVLSLSVLLFQGLNFNDIKNNIEMFNKLVNAPSLKIFFSKFGNFPNLVYLIKLVIQNKIFSIFGFLPIIILSVFIKDFSEIYKNKPLFIFVLCCIVSCIKSFFFLNINHMGVFLFPFCILAFTILFQKYFKNILILILAVFILLFAADDFTSLKDKNYLLETQKGNIHTFKKDGGTIRYVYDYILNNSSLTDKVIVMPEGSIINFITDRKGDNLYYNLSPLFYEDVFGDEKIVKHFEQTKPEFIVILPINNIEYGKSYFGIDYAQNFYEMILNNYFLVDEHNKIKIFRRKN